SARHGRLRLRRTAPSPRNRRTGQDSEASEKVPENGRRADCTPGLLATPRVTGACPSAPAADLAELAGSYPDVLRRGRQDGGFQVDFRPLLYSISRPPCPA